MYLICTCTSVNHTHVRFAAVYQPIVCELVRAASYSFSHRNETSVMQAVVLLY